MAVDLSSIAAEDVTPTASWETSQDRSWCTRKTGKFHAFVLTAPTIDTDDIYVYNLGTTSTITFADWTLDDTSCTDGTWTHQLIITKAGETTASTDLN